MKRVGHHEFTTCPKSQRPFGARSQSLDRARPPCRRRRCRTLSLCARYRRTLLRYAPWSGKTSSHGLGWLPRRAAGTSSRKGASRQGRSQPRYRPHRAACRAGKSVESAAGHPKTFEEAAKAYMEAHEKAWKNPKHRAQWGSTLKTYAYPHIGSLLVKDIDQEHVMRVLEPIWATKTETATRLRGRIESVLDWATTRKYRSGENPARWKGHLITCCPRLPTFRRWKVIGL